MRGPNWKFLAQEVARQGHPDLSQGDARLHAYWELQGEECPFCGEHCEWHRGVLYRSGEHLVWVCLVCSLLEVAAQKGHFASDWAGDAPRDLSLPDRYTIVWLSHAWLEDVLRKELPASVEVAKQWRWKYLEPHVRSALVEGRDVVHWPRRHFQSDEGIDHKGWIPFLVPGRVIPPVDKILEDYFPSRQAVKTTKFIHDSIGLKQNPTETMRCLDNIIEPMWKVESDLLNAIQGMDEDARRHQVPRVGVVETSAWSDAVRCKADVTKVADVFDLDSDWKCYLIPFCKCATFYSKEKTHTWSQPIHYYRQFVGFDIAMGRMPESEQGDSLWSAVFGDL